MNAGVPMISPLEPVASSTREMPKSMTRGPSGPISRLPGLKSRWTTPARWMAASAASAPTARRDRRGSVTGPCPATVAARETPSTYSPTRYGVGPSVPESRIRAVQNEATRRRIRPSARKRSTAAASSRRCRTFTATREPSAARPR
nr:hypothetical protein GCM10020093_070000 [Planobispora longispora]